MTVRTTISEVKTVIATRLSDEEITSFINIANRLVNKLLGSTTALEAVVKKDIETYLTAHLIAVSREQDKAFSRQRTGQTELYVGASFGTQLDATLYGQTIKMLDTTGAFASVGKRRASIRTHGTKTPYEDDLFSVPTSNEGSGDNLALNEE